MPPVIVIINIIVFLWLVQQRETVGTIMRFPHQKWSIVSSIMAIMPCHLLITQYIDGWRVTAELLPTWISLLRHSLSRIKQRYSWLHLWVPRKIKQTNECHVEIGIHIISRKTRDISSVKIKSICQNQMISFNISFPRDSFGYIIRLPVWITE